MTLIFSVLTAVAVSFNRHCLKFNHQKSSHKSLLLPSYHPPTSSNPQIVRTKTHKVKLNQRDYCPWQRHCSARSITFYDSPKKCRPVSQGGKRWVDQNRKLQKKFYSRFLELYRQTSCWLYTWKMWDKVEWGETLNHRQLLRRLKCPCPWMKSAPEFSLYTCVCFLYGLYIPGLCHPRNCSFTVLYHGRFPWVCGFLVCFFPLEFFPIV